MKSSQYVAISICGEIEIHAPAGAGADYATLCGLDGDDPILEHVTVKIPHGAKIDCKDCWAIFEAAKELRKTDFKEQP